MICFPLDNTPYEAKDMGTYLATRTRGVFSSDGNLAVTPSESGLSVSVSPGLAWLKWSDYWGTAALQEQALTLDLDTADGALKRIDAIVCRLDKVNNRAEIVVKKGAPSSAPIVVPPVRDANYDELYIATVLIGAGVISISASAITDQRLNEEYCGLMRDGVTGIPTASLHAQAQQILTELTDALNAQIVRQSAEFDAWFEDLKGKLGEDPATALQQQVDNLNAAVVGDAFQASGTPVSIAYAGTNRIASITAYGENAQGGTTEAPVALTGISSITVNDDVTELPIPRPLRRVGDVRDVCRTRVKSVYDKRVVLDGSSDEVFIQTNIIDGWIQIATESDAVIPESTSIVGSIKSSYLKAYAIEEVYSKKYSGISVDSNRRIRLSFKTSEYPDVTSVETAKTYLSAHPLTVYYQSTSYDGTNGLDVCLTEYQTGYIKSYADESITTAWISSTGALSTGAEIAYVLSSPETYATEPLDFDNAAGPLTVMTGGELEVRMTELIGSRSDVSNNTVAFTETAQDADIASGEKLSVLFGKIKKRFSVVNKLVNGAVYPNLGTNTNFSNPINQRGAASYTGDSTSPYCIDRWRISNGTTYTVGTFTLSAANYANRACGMLQTNLLGEHWLSIGDNVTVSIYANGQLHTAVMQVLDRGSYSSFADVPAGYTCDDFEIVLCTYAGDNTAYNLGIYPKKPLTVNYIKWEKGSVATPYVPKGYGAELLACQRYYVPIGENTKFFGGIGTAGNVAFVGMILPVQMRVTPSFTSDLNVVLRTVQGEQNIHGPVISKMTENNLAFTVTLNSGTTKSTPCAGYFYNECGLSADL